MEATRSITMSDHVVEFQRAGFKHAHESSSGGGIDETHRDRFGTLASHPATSQRSAMKLTNVISPELVERDLRGCSVHSDIGDCATKRN